MRITRTTSQPGPLVFRSWLGAFPSMVKPLADAGVSVVNCSGPDRADVFPRQPLEETL
jgi:hypothetical protein